MSLAYFARNARSAERMRERIRRSGMVAGHKVWTDAEREILKGLVPDYKAVRRRLRSRTAAAIQAQSCKLGLTKPMRYWTAAEISKLRRIYPTATKQELCEAFPFSTWQNIKAKAMYYKFRKRRVPFKLTGIPGLDEVRKRCYEIGWSMRDLDSAARTGSYFRRAGWIGKRINHRALGRAIEALDGAVMPEWARYE